MVSEDLLRLARLRSSVPFPYRHGVDVDQGLKRDFESPTPEAQWAGTAGSDPDHGSATTDIKDAHLRGRFAL